MREQHGTAHGGGGFDVLDPASLLGALRLERTGVGQAAGRSALLVRGRRRPSALHGGDVQPGIEEIAVALDPERGVVLRFVQLVDGEPASVREVEEIAFDEELPPETWEVVPPAGMELPRRPEPLFTTLDAAVATAGFRVWKLDPVPTGWRVQAVYSAPLEAPPLPEW